ncbi:MAG: DUF4143 domain-containing protein [Clostridia bacterium]|nr:DUF4143 domain-containing protein [Clostridia bacterium]
MSQYRSRIADKLLKEALEARGAVLVQGPKWCGKTTTAEQIAKSIIRMDDPVRRNQYAEMVSINPSYILEGTNPRLIDEWQLAPKLWDAVRYEIDRRGKFGQFILTGSAVPPDKKEITHTGTGRISKISMSTMTLFESGDSSGTVSFQSLFDGESNVSGENQTDLKGLAFLVCRGGWPLAVGQSEGVALRQARDYYDALVETDMSEVDGVERSEERVKLLLRSYSRNICTQAKNTQIRADMLANDTDSLSEDTVLSYVNALKKLFAVAELPAWNPNLRSKAAIRTSNTRHFVDPSIAISALGLGPKDLINDLNTFGFMFESMCVRDLRVYADYLDGTLYHYRDSNGLESDAVIHLRNGDWAAIEIKLGTDHIDEAAKNLLALKANVNTEKMKEPAFLMVISGTAPFAYRRADGVYVVPVDCLKY